MANKKKKRPTPPPPPVRRTPPRAQTQPEGPTKRQQERTVRSAQQRRDRLRSRLATAGVVVVVLALVGAYLVVDRRQDAQLRSALTAGSCQADSETDPTQSAGQNHVPNPVFAVNPPAGGNHLGSAARGGVYAGTSAPQEGLLVHSLEHGYIVVWHSPDLPEEQKEQLVAFEAEHEGDVIVTEKADLPVPVAATAWNRRLLCQQVESAPLQRFFDEYVGDGPEDVGRG